MIKEKDEVEFDIIRKAIEKFISVTHGFIRFSDSYRFLSSSLDSIVETLVHINHKTLEDFKEETVDNDEFLYFVNEVKKLIEEDKYNNDSIKDFKDNYPHKIKKLEEEFLFSIGENDLKILKTEISDKWKYLTKKIGISI